jgi:hypothetical protein
MTTCATCGAHQVERDWLYLEKPQDVWCRLMAGQADG